MKEQDYKEIVLEYHVNNKPAKQIAQERYLSLGPIYKTLRKYSIKYGYVFGNQRKRYNVRKDYSEGMKPREIAIKYSIKPKTVYGYLYNKEYGGKPERENKNLKI